jgi:hypothetical protein
MTWVIVITLASIVMVFFLLPSFSGPGNDCSTSDGSLSVQNLPKSSVHITLRDNRDSIVKSLYLSEGSKGDIGNICGGIYRIHYEFGQGWYPASQKFSLVLSKGQIDTPLIIQGDSHWDALLTSPSGNLQTDVNCLLTTNFTNFKKNSLVLFSITSFFRAWEDWIEGV